MTWSFSCSFTSFVTKLFWEQLSNKTLLCPFDVEFTDETKACDVWSKIFFCAWEFFANRVVVVGYFQNLDLDPGPGPWKTWTLEILDAEKPGRWKIWTLKNLDPEKHESWKTWNKQGIKNMFYKDHAQCGLKNFKKLLLKLSCANRYVN